ncbi:hypothetical protein AAHE18_02G205800 [Arachis hypogaea]
MVPCRVAAVKYMADPETDEVYAKLRLLPLSGNDADYGNDAGVVGGGGIHEPEAQDKPASFAKTLTQSDANNGGGFSVPRYCAETIFPRLDYSADPPVQMLSHVLYRDINGAVKHLGDEPFSDFSRTTKRLTILMDSSSDNVGV